MNENQKNKAPSVGKIVSLVKELMEIQAKNAILTTKIFAREGKEQIQDKTSKMKETMLEQAKKYGKKAEELAQNYNNTEQNKESIVASYQSSLADLQKKYEERLQDAVKEKERWQEREQRTILKQQEMMEEHHSVLENQEYKDYKIEEAGKIAEIRLELEKGNLDGVTAKTEQLKKMKKESPFGQMEQALKEIDEKRQKIQDILVACDQEIKNCEKERDQNIEQLTIDQNKQLAMVPKQNVWQRMVGKLWNKLNGVGKFKQQVIDQLSQKVDSMKQETIPAMQEKMNQQKQKFMTKMKNAKEELYDRSLETKETLLQRAESKLKDSIEKGKEKQEKSSEKWKNLER